MTDAAKLLADKLYHEFHKAWSEQQDENKRHAYNKAAWKTLSLVVDEVVKAMKEPELYVSREGWTEVPIKPTDGMLKAGWAYVGDDARASYEALLGATPRISHSPTKE